MLFFRERVYTRVSLRRKEFNNLAREAARGNLQPAADLHYWIQSADITCLQSVATKARTVQPEAGTPRWPNPPLPEATSGGWSARLMPVCRQRPNCTQQSLCRVRHSAKNTQQKIDRHSPFCRVSFIGHSAKALPRAPGALDKEKRPSRRQPR